MSLIQKFFVCSCVCVSMLTHAQDYTFYTYPNTLPSKYEVNIEKVRNEVLSHTFPKVKKGIVENYAEKNANFKYELLTSGYTYVNWDMQEAYINAIVQELLPSTLKNKDITAYIVRDAEVNAFAIFDGSLFFNVGYLANIHSEAGLYFVVAHELSHIFYSDLISNFVRANANRKKFKTRDEQYDFKLNNARYSRQQEYRADSLACVLISQLGYRIKDFVPDFYALLALEEKYKNSLDKKKYLSQVRVDGKTRIEKEIDDMSTHPEIEMRIQRILSWAEKLDAKNSYREDSPLFLKTRESFVHEKLKLLHKQHSLKECTEYAFIQHTLHPENTYYEYILLESLRKQLYLDSTFANKTFISFNYPSWNQTVSIFENLPLFVQDSMVRIKMQASQHASQKNVFKTNSEAFKYFASWVDPATCHPETLLSLAIYYTFHDFSKSQIYFDAYQNNKNSFHKEFAKNLKNKQIRKLQGSKKLVVYNYLNYNVRSKYGVVSNYNKAQTHAIQLYQKSKSKLHAKFPQYDFYALDAIAQNNMEQADVYKDIIYAIAINYKTYEAKKKIRSSSVIYFSDAEPEQLEEKKFEIFLYDPSLWQFLHDNDYNEVQYISLNYFSNKRVVDGLSLMKIIFYPYLIGLNNLRENYIKSNVVTFNALDNSSTIYSTNLYRTLTKKNFIKITRKTIRQK